MEVNQPDPKPAFGGVLRAVAVLAVMVLAGIGILAVLGIIPQEALQEWATKIGLIAAIIAAAAVVLGLLARSGK